MSMAPSQRKRSLKFGWIGVELKKEDGCSRGDPEMLYGDVECYAVAPVQTNSRYV